MNNSNQNSRTIGNIMLIIFWGLVLVLAAFFIDNQLNKQQNPNQNANSKVANNGLKELILQPNKQHHYVVNGRINGQAVTFLIDTGATQVAIPGKLAEQLGLKKGYKGYAHTANGTAAVYQTVIQQLDIAGLILNNVQASISPGMEGEVILLGMSALKQLQLRVEQGQLILGQ